MLAPRHFSGGVAVNSMKAIRCSLPRGRPYDDRALALAKRLIPDLPSWLNPPTSEKRWMILWAAIGMELAEKESEFGWGPGRRPGSKNKQLALSPLPDALRKRRQRQRGGLRLVDLIRWDKK
jgi:hypothetical protein